MTKLCFHGKRLTGAVLFLSGILFSFVAEASVITLSSGEEISGTIKDKTPDYIVIDTDKGTKTFYKDEIFSIKGQKPLPPANPAPAEMTVEEALRVASQGQFLYAEEAFRQLLLKDPSKVSAHAIEIINDLRNGAIEREYALALFEGAYYFYNQDFQHALDVYAKALEQYPDGIELYYNIANTHLMNGNADQAAVYFEKLLERRPGDNDLMYDLAVAYKTAGKYDKAIFYLEKVTAAFADRAEAWLLLASSYAATGQMQPSQNCLLKAKAIYSRQGDQEKTDAIDQLLADIPQ